MPADAADLLCEYYLQQDKKSLKLIDKDREVSMHLESSNMDLFKSKFTTSSSSNINKIYFNKSSTSSPTSDCTNGTTCKLLNKSSPFLNLNWSKIRKIGAGLLNLGNNCYLNATLQCLAYTPPLSQWLVVKPHSPGCKLKQLKGFCSLCEVEKIIYDLFNSCNTCVKPNSLCYNIKSLYLIFLLKLEKYEIN